MVEGSTDAPDLATPHREADTTRGGRKLRAWAAERGPEVCAAADVMACALWLGAKNPPSPQRDAILTMREAEFYAATGRPKAA